MGSEVELVADGARLGEKLRAFYREKCGYVELTIQNQENMVKEDALFRAAPLYIYIFQRQNMC
jgi:hypothetical protein